MALDAHQENNQKRQSTSSVRELERTHSVTAHSVVNVIVNQKPSFTERLCSKDSHKFRKYIENTTTHGVVRIFTGKSKVRRLFWAIVFVSALGFCLANIGERIRYLAGDPTTTTVTQKVNRNGIWFPAVTICNVNVLKRSVFESMVDESMLNVLTSVFVDRQSEMCYNETLIEYLNQSNLSYRHIQDVARHQAKDLIVSCTFAGEECSHTDFSEVLTRLGYCYTFNNGGKHGDRPLLKSQGIGVRYGLSLILNIEQDEYLEWPLGLNAGVMVAIHPQNYPPVPDDIGIAVPPGRNMFIGIRQKNLSDTSTISQKERRCREVDDTSGFNFLHNISQYSSFACLVDCFFTNITEQCKCIETSVNTPPASSPYHQLPDCSSAHLCCVLEYYDKAHVSLCSYTILVLILFQRFAHAHDGAFVCVCY